MAIVETDILKKLEPVIKQVIDEISKAVADKRPIMIRHHADCDGYSAAVALERAILPMMSKTHRRDSDLYYFYRRLPSRAPFYDYTDAVKDVSSILTDSTRFERKKPLLIVVDNGSSKEDLVSLKKLKDYGVRIVVIDHHPNNDENDNIIDVHLNPHKVGSATEYCAGMICAEIAHLMQPNAKNLDLIAALAGVADHSRGEAIDKYVEISKKAGYDYHRLMKIAEVIDFETHSIGYLESRYLVQELFFGKMLDKLIDNIMPTLDQQQKDLALAVNKYRHIVEKEGFKICTIDADQMKHGSQPGSGKITKTLNLSLNGPNVSMGMGKDYITFRITDDLPHDVNVIISRLQKDLPHALVQGGGHAHAGTLKFIPAAREEVINKVMEYL